VTPFPSLEFAWSLAARWMQPAFAGAFVVVQALALLYSSHRWLVLWRSWRGRRAGLAKRPPATVRERWPSVTVQLPIYNERRVVRRLIAAAAALDYPHDRLEIQVLDDSTDETSALAAEEVERQRARGVAIHHVRRTSRDGYKAGALAAGLERSSGELLAVFDADFVPPPDFLRRMVPRLDDPAIGSVQARWTHLNRRESLLTAAQAVMLDAHFLLEHPTRAHHDLFFNFNGTAGLWRRSCIEDAGGWRNDTLTEDLDLSYRAQLRGWRLAYAPDVEVPGELPAGMEALKTQQRRWARGSIQTARLLLPELLRRPLPLRVKLEAVVHLTGFATYPLLLALGLFMLPLVSNLQRPGPVSALELAVVTLGVIPAAWFLIEGQRLAGQPMRRIATDVPGAFVLGIGLSLSNARAVLGGLGSRLGRWERTPKSGARDEESGPPRYREAPSHAGASELVLAAYFAITAAVAWNGPFRAEAPNAVLIGAGFGWAAWSSWRAARAQAEVSKTPVAPR
jgi:hypothetical protein